MTLTDSQLGPMVRRLRVAEIMDENIPVLRNSAPVSRAGELFAAHPIYSLPVVDQEGVLQGVISHKYLYKTQSPRRVLTPEIAALPGILLEGDYYYDKDALDRYALKDIMNTQPVTISPEATVAEAIALMSERKVGCVPVLKGNRKVVGMLTQQNIVDTLAAVLAREDAS